MSRHKLPLVGSQEAKGAGEGARVDETPARRLSHAQRHRQLLEIAMLLIREEGADRLTLGRLAARAGVSKPVAYDHFGTRSALLIELYTWIDTERVAAFQTVMAVKDHDFHGTTAMLAAAYIDCAADVTDEFHAVGAALAGSEEKAAVFQKLLDNSVRMFAAVLAEHSSLARDELERCCIGLVGAGEALSAAVARDRCRRNAAVATLTRLLRVVGTMQP